MRGKALIYQPLVPAPQEHEFTEPPSLEWLQEAVGGYIEAVPYFQSTNDGNAAIAYCNEYGRLKRMVMNEAATRAWAEAMIRSLGTAPGDVLMGPVVVLTGDDEFMEHQRTGGEDDE